MAALRAAVPAAALPVVTHSVAGAGLTDEVDVVAVPAGGDLVAGLAGVEFLVLDHERRDVVAVLSRLPALRVVQVLIVGTEWVAPHLPPGVELSRPTGTRDRGVAEWVVSALVGVASGLLPAVRDQHRQRWTRSPSRELAGQRVVVAGQGSTGRLTATLLAALGVDVVAVAAHARPGVHPAAALPDLLPDADALVLLVPATAATTPLVDAALLTRMRTGALLVNASRGTVVDPDALLAELTAGRLHAVLDVTAPEPLPPGHPLWQASNCFVSPHVAGATVEGRDRAIRFAAEQLVAHARRRLAAAEPV